MRKLSLIDSDSICLRIALDTYDEDNNKQKYLDIAGINYGNNSRKQEKRLACITRIYELIETNSISNEKYEYLSGYKKLVANMLADDTKEKTAQELFTTINNNLPQWYKALFKILP